MSKAIKLERTAIRLHYRQQEDARGAMALQYENEFANQNPERNPIYVGWEGEQGTPLHEVLSELDLYRSVLGGKSVFDYAQSLERSMNERVTALEKRWWRQ